MPKLTWISAENFSYPVGKIANFCINTSIKTWVCAFSSPTEKTLDLIITVPPLTDKRSPTIYLTCIFIKGHSLLNQIGALFINYQKYFLKKVQNDPFLYTKHCPWIYRYFILLFTKNNALYFLIRKSQGITFIPIVRNIFPAAYSTSTSHYRPGAGYWASGRGIGI